MPSDLDLLRELADASEAAVAEIEGQRCDGSSSRLRAVLAKARARQAEPVVRRGWTPADAKGFTQWIVAGEKGPVDMLALLAQARREGAESERAAQALIATGLTLHGNHGSAPTCSACGFEVTLVRPGKHQCDVCPAIAQARREGAEDMRERAALACESKGTAFSGDNKIRWACRTVCAGHIRALPLDAAKDRP